MYAPSTYARCVSKIERQIDIGHGGWSPDVPFNDLPRLPPSTDLETREVLKSCVGARAALGELKQAANLIPNQGMLINTLPLLEAQASSEIENVVTTADELFRAAAADLTGSDPATREALGYREALMVGFRSLAKRPLGTGTAELVATTVKGVAMSVRRTASTTLIDGATGEVVYTPPQGEQLLRDLLANWEVFLHEDSQLDPLVKLAVCHYQFEAIHPFTDGNGRTGRVLNSLVLIEEGLLSLPILYLSRYLINNKNEYYRLLREVTARQAWEPWLVFVIAGIEQTAQWTLEKIAAVTRLMAATIDFVRKELPDVYSRELIDIIFTQPYSRIANVVDRGIAKRQTASKYLHRLAGVGVLGPVRVGNQTLFVHRKLLSLLTRDGNDFEPYIRNGR